MEMKISQALKWLVIKLQQSFNFPFINLIKAEDIYKKYIYKTSKCLFLGIISNIKIKFLTNTDEK